MLLRPAVTILSSFWSWVACPSFARLGSRMHSSSFLKSRPFRHFHQECQDPLEINPLVAERAPWRSSQSCVPGVSSLLEIPTDSCHFFCTPRNPCPTPTVTRGEGSFSYQGVSTRGVRHTPVHQECQDPLEINNLVTSPGFLSENSRILDTKSRLKSANPG